jgi:hypothetical protein
MNADGVIDNRDASLILAIAVGRILPPPDLRRLQARENGNATATVTGRAGAVPPGSTVTLLNTTHGATASVIAASDGSFGSTLAGVGGDTIVIDINGGPARTAIKIP